MFYPTLVLALATGGLDADTTLTLAGARTRARESNPQVVAARSGLAAARSAARQAGAWRDPTLAVGREQTGGRVWQNTVLLDQPLEVFGQRSGRGAAGRAHAEVAQRSFEATVRLVEAAVTVAYAAAQAADHRVLLADSIVVAFARAIRIIDARLGAGDASGYEARRLRLEASRYDGARAEAGATRLGAHATLAILLGLNPSQFFALADRLEVGPLTLSPDSLAVLAAEADGRARVATAEASAASADAIRLRRERVPVPSLGIGYKEETAGGVDRLSGYLAQLSVPLPVWGSRSAAASVGVAQAERLAALAGEATLAARRDALVTAGHANAIAQRHAALAARLGPEADRARSAADAAFENGEMTLLEWLDAVRTFHDAAVEEANLVADFLARVAELERLTGLNLLAR